jgi:hypothetical protein
MVHPQGRVNCLGVKPRGTRPAQIRDEPAHVQTEGDSGAISKSAMDLLNTGPNAIWMTVSPE